MPTYTRSNLKSRINAGILGKIGMLVSSEDMINQAAREVASEMDLRSLRRKADLSPKLFEQIYDYASPSDLLAYKIIDIVPQIRRTVNDLHSRGGHHHGFHNNQEWYLVPSEEFDRLKRGNMVAFLDANFVKKLRIAAVIDDKTAVISEMDSLSSGGGTWEAFGDGTNLRKDNDNFVKGNGSIRWDISSAGGTTAGIKNTSLNSFDLDDNYLGGNGAAFVWVFINSVTDITNYILRLGSSESDYNTKTITSAHDGTGFVAGWNLLRFDLTNLSQVGTPNNDAINFAAIFMTKATGKVSETDYRFDWLVLKKGQIYEVHYYSKFAWQTSAGVYIENSTDDSDLLNADTDEFQLFIKKAVSIAAEEVSEGAIADKAERDYKRKRKEYQLNNPSEAKIMTSEYYDYGNSLNSSDHYHN